MYLFRLLSALKNRRERYSGQPASKARRTYLTLESLEDRCLTSTGVADPPTPVGVSTAFGVGIGPGMQIDFFETDQKGQVFAQPVMNLFGHFGATVFINSHVVISNVIPQDNGSPWVTIPDAQGNPHPVWVPNPHAPNVAGPLSSSLLGSIPAPLGSLFGLPPTSSSSSGGNTGGGTVVGGGGQGNPGNPFPAQNKVTYSGQMSFSVVPITYVDNDGDKIPTKLAPVTANGQLTITMSRVDENSPWDIESATVTLKMPGDPVPVNVLNGGGQLAGSKLDLSGKYEYAGLGFSSPDSGLQTLLNQPFAFALRQLNPDGSSAGNYLIVAGTFNNVAGINDIPSQFNGSVYNPGKETALVQQPVFPEFWDQTAPGVGPGYANNPNGPQYAISPVPRQGGVQLQEQK